MNKTIFTIGHSTRSLDKFLQILEAFRIETVADVRTIPKSQHNPQFNIDSLTEGLETNGIGYLHLAGLGGLRKTRLDSINIGWKNLSYRGYADYMQTSDFEKSLDQLITIAERTVAVIMCAEAVPWRCHRSLIGDALLVRCFKVEDIVNDRTSRPHKLTSWASVEGCTITYPG
jgi:uncharacterized protein (DUF488 family)